jgi:HAD superfamily hydrolase (TIGR01509 family)
MHILIDIDDVVVESTYKDINGQTQFFWTENLKRDLGIPETSLGALFNETWNDVITGRRPLDLQVNEYLKHERSNVTPAEFITYWFEHDARPNHHAIGWLRRMREEGHELHIASNQEPKRIGWIANRYPEIFNQFGHQFISAELGVTKPHMEFYQQVLDRLGVSADGVVLIDDSQRNLTGAKGIGIKGFLYDRYKRDIDQQLVRFIGNL